MGIFDRLAGGLERGNTAAVYEAELARLEERIITQKARIRSIRVEARTRADEVAYEPLISEAERQLAALEDRRRVVELERHTGPAAQSVAEARVGVADDASGLGASASSSALSSVRDDVESKKQRASGGYLDANGIPIHGRQGNLDRKAKEAKARAELERLKALRDED